MTYADRRHAGRMLAEALARDYMGRDDLVVLALPRGGVPVAYEVAARLNAPLDVFVVRKLGVPDHEELAMGALAGGGICVLNHDVVATLGLSKAQILGAARSEMHELSRREQAYRAGQPSVDVCAKTVILIDDGLATGATMRVAIRALRQHTPASIVAAVPVADAERCADMADEADRMLCLETPERFVAVAQLYHEFEQTSDEEVRELLLASARSRERPALQATPA